MSEAGLDTDVFWMQQALLLAKQAEREGEVPVGALIVRDNALLAQGYNRSIGSHDASAHAEIEALRAAGEAGRNYRLPGSTLYVTLEPCTMCAGAIIHARIERLVFGAFDPKTGAAGSNFNVLGDTRHNHMVVVSGGILAEECGTMLKDFFRNRRV